MFYSSHLRSYISYLLFLFLVFSTLAFSAQSHASSDVKPLVLPRYVELCGTSIDTYRHDIRERIETRYYAYLRDKSQMILWMKRMKRYFPVIEETLARHNLPDDLKYMTVVESSLIPRSYSSRGAVGIWQFVKDTGRKYGLTIKHRYDERRDVYKASAAAAKYLAFLYDKFGSWELAMASYNIGENRIVREVQEQGTSDFYEMMLPRETDEYIINVIVVKHLMENPELYDIDIKVDEYFEPYDFKEVEINVSTNKIPVFVIARASKSTPREIKTLNPQIIGNFIYRGRYSVRIPAGGGVNFNKMYAKALEEYEQNNTYVKVTKEKAILRNGPGKDYDSLQVVTSGTKLKFVSTSENLYYEKPWYEVMIKDKTCWVWSGLVTFVD